MCICKSVPKAAAASHHRRAAKMAKGPAGRSGRPVHVPAMAEQQDFCEHQCAAYNDVPYDGTLYTWTPLYDYVEPCALTCRGRSAHLYLSVSASSEGVEDPERYDDHVIVQLSMS
nr:ADAMTS-like protein 1 isoform X2 [Bactrocera oleae]